MIGNFDSELIETAKFTFTPPEIEWIKTEEEFQKVRYLYIAEKSQPNVEEEEEVVVEERRKGVEIEEEIKEDLNKEKYKEELRKSNYMDNSLALADIDLKFD